MRLHSYLKILREYGRGAAGGLLFGTPLIFTMEMWWLGFSMPPSHILAFVLGNFFLLVILEKYSGFRHGTSLPEEIQDAIVAQGIGMVISVLMLWMLNVINLSMNIHEIVGKVVMETVAVSIGVSVAMAQLGEMEEKGQDKESVRKKAGFGGAMSIALAGAVFFGLNVAPTEEPQLIAIQISNGQALATALLSLFLVFAITYGFNFKGGRGRYGKASWINVLFRDSVNCYCVAMIISFALLWLFGRIDGGTGLNETVKMTVALGFVNSLGAAAAKLIL